MSLTVHRVELEDGRAAMYTEGLHPRGRELYTEGVDTRDAAEMAAILEALAALHQNFGAITEIQVGDTVLLFTALDELPPHMTRCSRDARCFFLFPVVASVPAPPPREMCPVCLEPDRVHGPISPAQFTEDQPGEMLWCSNGHGVCVECVRGCDLRRCSCGATRCRALSFKCPLCRVVTPLGPAEADVLLWGSWHRSRQSSVYSVSL